MRHLKRFKNWLGVVYCACLAFSAEYQNRNHKQEGNEPQANHITLDDALAELEPIVAAQQSEDSEVSAQQQQAALEMLDTIAQGTSEKAAPVGDSKAAAPAAEPETSKVVPPKPVAVSSAPVIENKPKAQPAPPVISPSVNQQGTNGAASEPQQTTGKYQPGAVNEQTAQRLARLLVSEIKLYHKSKTEGEDAIDVNIYDTLKEPIDKSRQHYKQRMGKTAIETMPDYFHGELVRSLCGGDASRLGPNYQPLNKTA
jgi:hypothetical protein